ncbi:nonribosomal peptide synthetase aclP [Colletotrichum asianum]|uniref:Nonribosomal peptide synthetase aclP n=1 Tax=Colletotrichum asianum TaxID=702518 RepID=A0A8H3ZWM0_9PEZI|nr:nonribosomal peptide synthetase aclP [Colletotrichum asianum]
MLDQTTKEAAIILNRHLNWKKSQQDEDNLVSWSSSLLFTLQYALYRHSERSKGRSAHNVHIIMIDTALFPKGAFIRDLEVMYCLRNKNFQLRQLYLLRTGQWGRTFSFGEYLSQSSINVSRASGVTSLKTLIDTGLFKEYVCPYLGDSIHWSRLAKRVLSLREEVDSLRVEHQAWASLEHARTFIAIAEACFGSHGANRNLAPAFAVMLLSLPLLPGFENDSVDAFLKLYPGT